MNVSDFTDETLMRYADGELDPQTATEIERAMETDGDLVSRVALFIDTRTAAQTALKPLLDEPVPPLLRATVERMVREKASAGNSHQVTILPFPGRLARFPVLSRRALPIAASLFAVVLGGVVGYWLAASGNQGDLQLAGISRTLLVEALATLPSGEDIQIDGTGQRLHAIATFRDREQSLCREFQLDIADRSTVSSVACHSDGEWRITFAVVAGGGDAGYAPASSTESLDSYLTSIHAGPPLEAADEKQALGSIR